MAQKVLEKKSTVRKQAKSTSEELKPTKRTSTSVKTFRRGKLEEAFLAFCQTVSAVPDATSTLEARIKQRLKTEIEFIANTGFQDSKSEATYLGDVLCGTGLPVVKTKASKAPALPAHLARLCESKLLKPEEEKILFQRMNYFRFRAQQYQSRLNPEKSTEWDLIRIEGLLRIADWHRDFIVRSNMRLVISIVKKFVNKHNAFDDLLSDGAMALMRAVEKFDYDRGFRFSTYATQVVRRNAYRMVMLKQKERSRIAMSTDESGIDISDETKEPAINEQRWNDLRTRLGQMLDCLERREKLIIRARFSLGGHRRVQTLQRLADILGVSKERVRQIEKRAMEKLRSMVHKFPLPELETSD